jgi:hypothetical protein
LLMYFSCWWKHQQGRRKYLVSYTLMVSLIF